MNQNNDQPLFARSRNDEETVELRVEYQRPSWV